MGETPRRTWRASPNDPAMLLLTSDDHDAASSVLVKVARRPGETPADFPERLIDDAAAFGQVLIELLAFGCTPEEIGGFASVNLTPALDALRGRWTWTGFVMNAKPIELSPWSDTPDKG